ncbi:MAG: ABC transporter substrate-binding protein, partial [SAR324 cluster bacterium]|nr:ABC transporter substrate-binding protein [SAR324 cluster bacterium]
MSKLPLISRFPFFPALLTASVLLLALASRPAGAQERVVLQLRWEHQFQFAGFYAAQWEGYFREAGLEVEIRSAVKPDGKVMSALKEVAEGRAHFGIGSPDILLARDRGVPLVVLAVLAQQSPVIVIARAALNVRKPADLAGLRVRRVPSDRADAEFQAMLRTAGVDLSQIRHSTMPYYRTSIYKELAQGTLDAVVTYSLTGLWHAERFGLQVSTLRPASYGVDFYGDSIFTVEQLVRERPQLVERFLQASLRGWRYALDHPEEIADRIAAELPRYYPPAGEERREFNRAQIAEVTRLSHYPIIELGHINPERWRRMHQTLMRSGLVQNELDLDSLIYDP